MATTLGRIVQGDCIKKLKTLDAGSVDLVFADPPFNIGYDYDEYDDKRSCEDYLSWSTRWISEVIRVLKPDGTFWLAIGDEYAAELKVMATRELGLTCRSWVVWYYTFGVHCKHKFTRSHAHLFYFVKDAKKFTFNTDDIRVPSARQLVYADRRANPKGRVPDDTWIIPPRGGIQNSEFGIQNSTFVLRPQDVPEGFTADSDTWYFPRVCGTFKERGGFHGCQMPEQLLGRIIKACSDEGDLVVDPFAGSGTTPAVAKKLGRKYLGIEISKQYVAETRTRLSRIKPGDLLDGAEDPLTSVAATTEGTIRTPDGKRVKRDGSARRSTRRRKPSEQPTLWE
ncbi:MAG: site-specific DNA-methyltransferase [Phycisphaerales bacterium]|nr:MAG: site-specific DNA-methyltransferase [Phycisphaerales bacterium]